MADQQALGCGPRCKEFYKLHWKGLLTLLFPIIFLPILFIENNKQYRCLYGVCIMGSYWVSEVVPLYVTALLPIIIFPPMGILDSQVVCQIYFKDTAAMYCGSLIAAMCVEYCNLHRRIALHTLLIVGCTPRRILLGLMTAAFFVSMWLPNSAATAIMLPIIKAVLDELQNQGICKIYADEDTSDKGEDKEFDTHTPTPSSIASCLYLSAPFGATFGGSATLIGSGANLTLKGLYDNRFPDSVEQIDFPSWMMYLFVPMLIMNLLTCVWMCFIFMGLFRPNSKDAKLCDVGKEGAKLIRKIVQQRTDELGNITMHEIQVLIVFGGAILLLFFRSPGFMPGWAQLFHVKIKTSLPLTVCILLLFMLPVNYAFLRYCCASGPFTGKPTLSLQTWPFLQNRLPWRLILLVGGGFAMSEACIRSGLSRMIGNGLEGLKDVPVPVIQLMCVLIAIFITQFCSNKAADNLIIPVVSELAIVVKTHPLFLVFPTGIGCGMSFVLPISTPPNALVSGYSNVKTKDMAIAGMFPVILATFVLSGLCQTWHFVVYPNSDTFPEWALLNHTSTA